MSGSENPVPLSPVSYVFPFKLNTIVLRGGKWRIAESFVWVVVIDTTIEYSTPGEVKIDPHVDFYIY